MHRLLSSLAVASILTGLVSAVEPDLSEYKTVENAVTAKIAKSGPVAVRKPGQLGIHVAANASGKLAVGEVVADSPAARAGIRAGDVLLELDGTQPKDDDAVAEVIHTKSAGDGVKLALARNDKRFEVTVKLEPPSRPLAVGRQKAILGVTVNDTPDGKGVKIDQITTDSAADRAKLKIGDVILKIDDAALANPDKLIEILLSHRPDDTVTLTILADGKTSETKVRLSAESSGGERPRGGFGRGSNYWTKPVFRLGIICVEYPDVKHNEKITPKAWEDAMFSEGTFTKGNATGQPTFGSMRDYYIEQSFGALKVEGRAFEYVEVSKKRAEYSTGNKSALLTEALDKLVERDADALKDLDGVFFVYAGERFQVPRGSLYWPHRSNISHKGKRWPYFICPEGGSRMYNISVFCHEFGHMLGLPDLYARPENPGMEGSGVWSAMANQVGNGKPQHFCAWSKEKLGWIKPTLIDPTVKQKLILGPIEDSPKECFKVLVKPDGSEYLLLENRKKKGFDASLPAEGLLIWRVVGNRPMLEESHGVEGPSGPRMFLTSVPYPTSANDSFTPYTTPSSRAQLGGGLPVYITNINKLADGRITFQIGYEYH